MAGGSKKRNPPSKAGQYMRKKRKQTITTRLKKVEKALNSDSLERLINEVISFTTPDQVASTAPLLLYAYEAAQGDEWYQRVGREVFLQSLVTNIDIRCGRTDANFRPPAIRVIIGFQRHAASTSFTAANICTDLFNSATPSTQAMYTMRVQGGLIGQKYIILRDKTFLGPGPQQNLYFDTAPAVLTTPWRRLLKFKVSLKNNLVRWESSGAGVNPEENRPFILIISDNSTTEGIGSTNPVDIYHQTRCFYTEKKVV